MTDFLDETRKEITDRLQELKPIADEYSRLEAAAAALAGLDGATSPSANPTAAAPATRRRGPGRPRGSANRASAKPKATAKPGRKPGRPAGRPAGRRKGSGSRAA